MNFDLGNSASAYPSASSAHDLSRSLDPRTFGLLKAAYSVNEAMQVLSMGRSSLYKAIAEGRLRPAKNGRQTLFLARDVAAFLASLPSGLRSEGDAR